MLLALYIRPGAAMATAEVGVPQRYFEKFDFLEGLDPFTSARNAQRFATARCRLCVAEGIAKIEGRPNGFFSGRSGANLRESEIEAHAKIHKARGTKRPRPPRPGESRSSPHARRPDRDGRRGRAPPRRRP